MKARIASWLGEKPESSRWIATWKQTVYAFNLTLERRLWLFLGLDFMLVVQGLVGALVAGGKIDKMLASSVFLPAALLCVPALSGIVALERRAGSLDLALSTPSTERYFMRRVVPICSLFLLQGAILLSLSYWESKGVAPLWSFDKGVFLLIRALLQNFLLHLFVAVCVLFWATRLRTSGGVWGATMVLIMLFRPFLIESPLLDGSWRSSELFFGVPRPLLTWIWSMAIVALASAILYLYSRERLRRPETMLD